MQSVIVTLLVTGLIMAVLGMADGGKAFMAVAALELAVAVALIYLEQKTSQQ